MGIQDRDYYREWLKEKEKEADKKSLKRHIQKITYNPKEYRRPHSTVIVKVNKANIRFILILISLTIIFTFTATMLVLIKSPDKLATPYLFLKNLFGI